jgi:hypothetical protein
VPKYLVSLAGELVIPNLLLIKTLQDIDHYLFLVPRDPESRDIVHLLCAVCGIAEPLIVEMDAYSLAGADRALAGFLDTTGQESEFVVNLTGGSRIMAISAHEAFRRYKSTILYLPPGNNNFQMIWPEHRENHLPAEYRTRVAEYLQAYGVESELKPRANHPYSQLETMFYIMTKNSNPRFMNKVNRLGAQAKDFHDERQMEQTAELFAKALQIDAGEVIRPDWLSFIKGAWFEEYVVYWINQLLGRNVARHGLVIRKDGVANELDGAFTHENILYFMEMKASARLSDLNEFLYKLDSIGKDFGLLPKCFLVVADPDVDKGLKTAGHFRLRAEKMGIGLITYRQLLPEAIIHTFKQLLAM